jgi:hypothetical protein
MKECPVNHVRKCSGERVKAPLNIVGHAPKGVPKMADSGSSFASLPLAEKESG